MKIVKNYGRTNVSKSNKNLPTQRILKLNQKTQKNHSGTQECDFPKFVETDPNLGIAQWISIIDKIYQKPAGNKQKPAGNKKVSRRTFEAREQLGDECWKIIIEKKLLGKVNYEEFIKIWAWKLHPYGEKTDADGDLLLGRLYPTFHYIVKSYKKPDTLYFNLLAKVIELHLYKGKIKTATKNKAQEKIGFIPHRANSIAKNTLAKNFQKNILSPEKCFFGNTEWLEEDEQYFTDVGGELAPLIFALYQKKWEEKKDCNNNILKDKNGHPLFNKKRLETSEYISKINEHFKHVLKPKVETKVMEHLRNDPKNGERNQRLMLLYTAIREFYKKIFRSPRIKDIDPLLPKNNKALFKKLRQRVRNRSINNLIRVGRVLHYEGFLDNNKRAANSENNIWKLNLEELSYSHYFSSTGQAEIKSTEAFNRIWRNSVSMGNRSLTNFVDPQAKLDLSDNANRTDILGGKDAIVKLLKLSNTDPIFNDFPSRMDLQFGKSSKFFKDFDSNILAATFVDYAKAIRNKTFHFGSQTEFSKLLKTIGEKIPEAFKNDAGVQYIKIAEAAKNFINEDTQNFVFRTYSSVVGAKLDYILSSDELFAFINFASQNLENSKAEFGLPKFSKLVKRHHNISGKTEGRLNELPSLPKPANRTLMENYPALRAQYVALKLVYEGVFKEWLADCTHDKINKFSKEAIARTSKAAKEINGEDEKLANIIESQAERLPLLNEGEKFVDLVAHITAETASEMRVQKAYNSDFEQAKKQAEWINYFKTDLVMLLFNDFCQDDNVKNIVLPILNITQVTSLKSKALPIDNNKITHEEILWPDWASKLYVFLHFVPIDEANLLYQQFLKWGALENKRDYQQPEAINNNTNQDTKKPDENESVNILKRVFLLYSKMHDDKFSGNLNEENHVDQRINIDFKPFNFLFENESALESLLGTSEQKVDAKQYIINADTASDLIAATRGLREISRFGHIGFIKRVHQQALEAKSIDLINISDIEKYRDSSWLNKVSEAQKSIETLSTKKSKEKWNNDDKDKYEDAVKTIAEHRALTHKISLIDIVKLHKITIELFGKMVDFSAQWERDQYFIVLAIIWIIDGQNSSVNERFSINNYIDQKSNFKYGRPPEEGCILKDEVKKILANLQLHDIDDMSKIRNNFAHFGYLDDRKVNARPDKNFTDLVTSLRILLSYDRKLKNVITLSLHDLLLREGFIIKWQMDKTHNLVLSNYVQELATYNKAKKSNYVQEKKIDFLRSDRIIHLQNKKNEGDNNISFIENKHTERMVALIKSVLSNKIYFKQL